MTTINMAILTVQNWVAELFAEKEEGQGLVEYGLILVLVAIVCIALLGTMGGSLQNVFSQVNANL